MNTPCQPLFAKIIDFAPGLPDRILALRSRANQQKCQEDFPFESISELAVWEKNLPEDPSVMLRYYVALAFGCLSTAFVVSQRHAALRRVETSRNPLAESLWLPQIQTGERFATVGISHLTTSRRHLAIPPMVMQRTEGGWLLNGSAPWVTGAPHADYLVVGAVEDAGEPAADDRFVQQYLLMLTCPNPGIQSGPGMPLVALTSSCTDVIAFQDIAIDASMVLHGPSLNVMVESSAGGAGGLQTSALALGLAATAIEYLFSEAKTRTPLEDPARALFHTWQSLYDSLVVATAGDSNSMRKKANDLALQATQAAMAAAKGAGFVDSHPVGRWCREALFFLVWSCPQPVAEAHLCSFADGHQGF